MRYRSLVLLLVAVLLGTVLVDAQQQQPSPTPPPAPPANSQAQEAPQRSQTTIPVQVNLFDDNVPQDIRYFSRQNDLPLRIGMLLDTSNSIRDRIKFEQDAANNFLFSVLRRNKDEAFLMTFDDEPQMLQA